MANFQLYETGEDISTFDLPLNREVTLKQSGGDFSGNRLSVELAPSTTSLLLKVLPDKPATASTLFSIRGNASVDGIRVSAYVAGTKQNFSEDLIVNVKAAPQKHPGFDVDLLSKLAISGNGNDIAVYTKVVNANKALLEQNTTVGKYNCGDVSAGYGPKIFKTPASVTYNVYYKKPTSDKMADLRFDPVQMLGAVGKIKALLSKGTPVRVWLIHADGFGQQIQGTDPTHFSTIFAYGGGKFLYLDPLPDGSKMSYEGGMYGASPNRYMGQFEFDLSHPELGIRNSTKTLGSMPYTIIAGP